MGGILVIDDDKQVCETLESLILRHQYNCDTAGSLREGEALLRGSEYDVVFLDVRLPDGNGLDFLPKIKALPNSPEVIILTGRGDPDGAELAIQGGVWDYLVKPSSIKQISLSLMRAIKYHREKELSKEQDNLDLEGVVGQSPAIRKCFELAGRAARSESNVLITGETGTGKELFARTIHESSGRRGGPFVVVDCASLTETLVESTLFGHRKGAFTGAHSDQAGLARLADGGTLFLDEVGELPLSIQKAFLRVLQERRFRPVGESREVSSDFRLISATNRDLEFMAQRGGFRPDLLFRLETMRLDLPPLREREGDVKTLAMYHLTRLSERYGVPMKGFDTEFVSVLESHDWPGNVRELFNVLERAFISAGPERNLYALHLPQDIRIKAKQANIGAGAGLSGSADALCESDFPDTFSRARPPSLKAYKACAEKHYLELLIDRTGGDLQAILDVSGLSRSHFYALLKKNNVSL